MLEWSIPEAEDEDWINSCIAVSGTMASDASFANIYLLRNKYSTKISRYKDFIIRKYSGKGARCGYTFPLGKGDVAKALAEIEKSVVNACSLHLSQKNKKKFLKMPCRHVSATAVMPGTVIIYI